MQLTVDLTGSTLPRDDLDHLRDARRAAYDLLDPGADLDRVGRERLYVLLDLLDILQDAVLAAAK